MTTHASSPALYLVCSPERTRPAAYIASSLGTPAESAADLNDTDDHSVLITGDRLEVNRWLYAASQRNRRSCVISLSGHHRAIADVVTWPRLAETAISQARTYAASVFVDPMCQPAQDTLFDVPPSPPRTAPPTPSAPEPPSPTRAHTIPPAATTASPSQQDPNRTPNKSAARDAPEPSATAVLDAWEALPDGSCCTHCPLCGANVRDRIGWHLSSASGHNLLRHRSLSARARAHYAAHLAGGHPTPALQAAARIAYENSAKL